MLTKKRREELALLLATRLPARCFTYDKKREQNSVAGQLRDEAGNQMFPNDEGKRAFDAFLQRGKENTLADSDGAIVLSLLSFNNRNKMKDYADGSIHPDWFIPGISKAEVIDLFTDKNVDELDLTAIEMLELAQLMDWIKQGNYRKIAR
jgi:hypothetical protein